MCFPVKFGVDCYSNYLDSTCIFTRPAPAGVTWSGIRSSWKLLLFTQWLTWENSYSAIVMYADLTVGLYRNHLHIFTITLYCIVFKHYITHLNSHCCVAMNWVQVGGHYYIIILGWSQSGSLHWIGIDGCIETVTIVHCNMFTVVQIGLVDFAVVCIADYTSRVTIYFSSGWSRTVSILCCNLSILPLLSR